jgi:hypothetical protein
MAEKGTCVEGLALTQGIATPEVGANRDCLE